jgi:hypothetical protein
MHIFTHNVDRLLRSRRSSNDEISFRVISENFQTSHNLHMRRTGCARCKTASLSVRIRGVGSIMTSRVHRLPGALLDIEKGTKIFFPRNVGDGRGGSGRKLFPSHHRHTHAGIFSSSFPLPVYGSKYSIFN